MTDLPPDPLVRRANQLSTTFLDLLGVLLLAGAVGWWLWEAVTPAAGLCAAGVLVLVMSLAAQHRVRPADVRVAVDEDERPLPGPTDPGPLHVMGR